MMLAAFVCAGIHGNSPAAVDSTVSVSVQGASTLEQYLAPVVAQDPKPFSSLAHADRNWMLKTAIWFATEQNRYPYTADNRQSVPADSVLSAYRTFFGKNAAPQFQTFVSDGITYTYQADAASYDVPVTAQKEVYTPRVTQVEQHGGLTVVTVGYIPSTGWTEKYDGTVVPPAPVKTMRCTLRQDGTTYSIVSIQHT